MNISSDDGDDSDLDPRIQIELENLNSKTDVINKLEIDLECANAHFRRLLTDSTERLKELSKKLGSCIAKARPYHEAVTEARKAQAECQKAALQFQRASEIHRAAKETVALAEQRFISKQADWTFDSAWQDMLNHATMKVTEAEHQKAATEQEHKLRAQRFAEAEKKVQQLESDQRRSIARSQPYFAEKEASERSLSEQKTLVELLQKQVAQAKQDYAAALRRLEIISDEIHCRRAKGPREPGVGAELSVEIVETRETLSVVEVALGKDIQSLKIVSEDLDESIRSVEGKPSQETSTCKFEGALQEPTAH